VSYERHMARALAALDDVSLRALEVVAEKLTRRVDGLREFGCVFGDAARARRGYGSGSASYHLETALSRVDDRLAAQIADAEAPFWAHVRDALAERHP